MFYTTYFFIGQLVVSANFRKSRNYPVKEPSSYLNDQILRLLSSVNFDNLRLQEQITHDSNSLIFTSKVKILYNISMEINFHDKKLYDLCESQKIATKKLGFDSAKKLRNRLNQLKTANTVEDLYFGNPHPLTGDRKGEFSLELGGGKRLTFVPDQDLLENESIDWSQVSKVKIVYIGDYHD